VAARSLVGVTAHDEQSHVLTAFGESRDRVEQRVEPLDRRDAADPQQDRAAVEVEPTPRLGAVARREQVRVDAARDRGDPRRVGRVVAQELGALHDVRGHDAVGRGDDARLLLEPDRRLQLGRAPGHPVLEPAQVWNIWSTGTDQRVLRVRAATPESQ